MLLQTRSVTGSARKLGISQPAVSRSLAQLRDAFQDPLLIRTNRGMELTRRGEELITPLQDWLASTTALFTAEDFDPLTLERTFRIASTDFGVLSVLGPALPPFRARAPRAVMEVVPFSDTMISRLGAGGLDLIITGIEPDFSATYGHHLFTEQNCCIVRADHPVLQSIGAEMQMEHYLQCSHISVMVGETAADPVSRFLGKHAAQRQVVARLPYFQVAPYCLLSSDAVLTLPRRLGATYAADPRFVVVTAPPEMAAFDYWALWHERSRRDPATMWLVDILVDVCASFDEASAAEAPALARAGLRA